MKTLNKLTPAELRKAGWEALNNKLGPAGALKFVMEYESGKGNYTELRRKIFEGKMVKDIIQDMKKKYNLENKSVPIFPGFHLTFH